MRDWADEPWVKLYIRDEADWLAMPFDAQAVLLMLLRKVDRAGFLGLGRAGLRALPAVLGHPADAERILAGLTYLVNVDGCLKLLPDGRLFWPNYSRAQAAKSSDKLRQQQKRERDRALADAQESGILDASGEVAASVRDETLCHAGAVTLDASRWERHAGRVTNRLEETRIEKDCSTQTANGLEPQAALPLPGAPVGAPAAARGKGKARKPGPREPDREHAAWAWMQGERAKVTDTSERQPKPAALRAMLKPPLDELGTVAFKAGYRLFLQDAAHAGKTPPWPLEAFLAQWRNRYAPRRPAQAASEPARVAPGEDPYRTAAK